MFLEKEKNEAITSQLVSLPPPLTITHKYAVISEFPLSEVGSGQRCIPFLLVSEVTAILSISLFLVYI